MKKLILIITLSAFGLTAFKLNTNRMISGTVYSATDSLAIPGVTIRVAGSNQATQTDKYGKYTISLPEGKTKLEFAFLGYKPQIITIKKSNILNVYLEESINSLNEVVVTGYKAQIRREVTGAVTTVSPNAMLNDKVYGVMVQGSPGSNQTIRIRGKASVQNVRFAAPVIKADEETYNTITENAFQDAVNNPLSTFSVDVDAASYSNFRRFINNGQLPPADAVRIEEMINYFKYDLAGPINNDPVAIHTELSSAPWNTKHRLLRIALKAKTIPTDNLPPSNLVFLIDVSGSMSDPNKLPLVKSSLKMLTDQLRPQDRVAMVVYAGAAGVVLPSTPGNKKTTIYNAIDNLNAGGSTAGGEGIKLAYKIAADNLMKKGNNRIILATDGDFNVGASCDEDMQKLIEKERESGISLSVLGYGMGNYKDSKMETLADKGNGNYAYIDNITEARKTLISEFGGTLFTVAKDVKLQIEFNPAKVQAYRLLGYENRILNKEDFNNDKKDAGDMGSGHNVTAFYEIIPAGITDDYTPSVDPLKYQKPKAKPVVSTSDEMLTIKFRYKEPNSSKSKLSQAVVMDVPAAFDKTSDDFKFAASIAEIGMLLRDSQFKQHANFEQAINIAKAGRGNDEEGYRSEFIRLAESAKLLSKTSALANVENEQ
ncbi:vWA domain-containing protein [Mucilaginibacter segetis]|uniref:von Willebrand factor type A domain-containing protein n=1 Tax=Mucilaginibacter segetis TaxID=2793071 RepID=A0A934PUQ1_9SPHI|nr:VWA domain-containing protein [Mucilaginibacter segetis]MBK0381183.1 von Willebrand factor type A domain-containing protein [Mucilaginibacter segetis]